MNSPARARPAVLCIDDDGATLTFMRVALKEFGCRPIVAAHGADALRLIQEQYIDVIVCDADMPGVGGAELLRRAAELAPRAGRVLLASVDDPAEADWPHVDEVLAKPLNREQICRAIGGLLRARGQIAAVAHAE